MLADLLPVLTPIVALSTVQGLTEFLPISSSMHLVLWDRWFWPHDRNLDIAVHCGSLLAVMLYFWREVLILLYGAGHAAQGKRTSESTLLGLLVLSAIPVVIAGYLLRDWGWDKLHTPMIIGSASFIFGLLLWWADRRVQGKLKFEESRPATAIILGLSQMCALVPGVSRSGVCMTAALALGFSRAESARIALLMSMPVIAAAGMLEGWYLWQADQLIFSLPLVLAVATAFVASYISIPLMLWVLGKAGFMPFVLYRCLLGVYLLAVAVI